MEPDSVKETEGEKDMYQTTKMTVAVLVDKMRNMEIGEEIGLAGTESGEYSYGIRRLPEAMFDNGMCWIADYYGGGSVKAFSETEEDFRDNPYILQETVWDWLAQCHLLNEVHDAYVNVQVKGELPETKWEFKQVVTEPTKNRLACVDFALNRPHRMYVAVPPEATDDEIQDIAKKALTGMTPEEFGDKVLAMDADLDPFIEVEDIDWMEVDKGYKNTTTSPVGTVLE